MNTAEGELDGEPEPAGQAAAGPRLRCLLVTWYFPPANTVAALRLGKMAAYLEQAGHELTVLTPEPAGADRSLPVEVKAGTVLRTPYLDLDRHLTGRPHRGGRAGLAGSNSGQVWQSARRRLGRLYREVVLYPDRRVDWLVSLLPALARQLRRQRPDLIIVSGPPFSTFLAVALAAGWHRLPWLAELRDRWTDDPYGQPPRWRQQLDRWLEQAVLRRAAGIVTVSSRWSDFYADRYGLPTETAMNGYDPADFTQQAPPSPGLPLRLLHAGTIYPGRRDPRALFEALRHHGFRPDEVQVAFYGRELAEIRALTEAYGLGAFIEIKDAVPYRQALALQQQADILLLLQWNDPADRGNVPAKLFEYLATGRQILGLGPLDGIPAQLVAERQAGLFCNEPAGIARQLRSWIEAKRTTGQVAPPPANAAAGLDRASQYRRLERFCQAVVRERQASAAPPRPALAEVLASPRFAPVEAALDRPILSVIIDTEAEFDWSGRFARDGHRTDAMLQQEPAQAIFARYQVTPTYLIDYPVASDPQACAILADFLARGRAALGIQLHPWTNPPFAELLCRRNSFPSSLPAALQAAKIERLIETVERNLGLAPKIFKAGRYGLADPTARLLERYGLEVDTSVVPFTDFSAEGGPSFYGCPDAPFWFGWQRRLLALPVTRSLCGRLPKPLAGALVPLLHSPWGERCHAPGIFARAGLVDRLTLTPEGLELADLRRLTRTLLARGQRIFTLLFHSPSLAPGNTPYVRDAAELGQFLGRIEGYLRFFMEELGGESLDALALKQRLETAAPAASALGQRAPALTRSPAQLS